MKNYKYDRPKDGQIEEKWWNALPEQERVLLLDEIATGWRARRMKWNATHPPERHLPRPEGYEVR